MKLNSFPPSVERVAVALCDALDSPLASVVKDLISAGDWRGLTSLRVDPRQYKTALTYFSDAAAVELLRKCQGLATGIDLEAAAKKAFFEGESSCFRTNRRFHGYLSGFLPEEDCVRGHLDLVQKIVADILGGAPSLVQGRFGPGTVFELKGLPSTVPDKIDATPHLYTNSWPWLVPWAGTAWASACARHEFGVREPKFVLGNRFATAPKDATTHRTIAIEASIPGFFQLGVGAEIRRRLRACAVDLDHGQALHREIARVGSQSGDWVTIDIRNASNTVALYATRFALAKSRGWRPLLESLRAERTLIDGKWKRLEMFSSMGNGYTFELETLLFYAVSVAASLGHPRTAALQRDVLVFGDDIIVRRSNASRVVAALRFWGFETNVHKTFVEGPFRESCGGDFFSGLPVRAHYVKKLPTGPEDWIALANGIRRLGDLFGRHGLDPGRFRRPWLYALDEIPVSIRKCRGPTSLGDIVIHDDPQHWTTRHKNGVRFVRCYRPVHSWTGWEHFTSDSQLATALLGIGDGLRGVIPRGSVSGFKQSWVPFS
jgi:hypothetical protein